MCFLRPLERATGYEVCCFKIRPVSTGSYDAPMRGTGLYLGGARVSNPRCFGTFLYKINK
jgi:hypothetical protein